MASEVVCGLTFRLLLPVCLTAACAFRYNGLSFVYLIYLLLIPLFSEPTKATMQDSSSRNFEATTGLMDSKKSLCIRDISINKSSCERNHVKC